MKTSRRNTLTPLLMFASLFFISPLLAQTKTGIQSKALQPPSAQPAAPKTAQVLLAVTVREKKHGDLVPNLTQSDFTLSVDHKPLAIQSFEPASNLPLTLGLLVDTSAGERAAWNDERTAAGRFLDQMLATPNQRVFLIQFAHEVDLLADISANKNALHSALDQLGRPQSQDTTADQADSGERHLHSGGGDNLYDAIYLASNELMKKQPDRKVLVVLTSGIDSGSKESLFSAVEAAQRAGTIVYAAYFKGEEQRHNSNNGFPGHRRGGMGGGYPGGGYPGGGYPGGGGGWPGGGGNRQPAGRPTEGSKTDGRKILEQICSETGGRMFEISHKMNFDQALAAIDQELRAQYIIGFTPGKSDSYSGYHRLDLTVNKKNTFVQTRQGYYSGDE